MPRIVWAGAGRQVVLRLSGALVFKNSKNDVFFYAGGLELTRWRVYEVGVQRECKSGHYRIDFSWEARKKWVMVVV